MGRKTDAEVRREVLGAISAAERLDLPAFRGTDRQRELCASALNVAARAVASGDPRELGAVSFRRGGPKFAHAAAFGAGPLRSIARAVGAATSFVGGDLDHAYFQARIVGARSRAAAGGGAAARGRPSTASARGRKARGGGGAAAVGDYSLESTGKRPEWDVAESTLMRAPEGDFMAFTKRFGSGWGRSAYQMADAAARHLGRRLADDVASALGYRIMWVG